jgi:hypothetical protein
MSGPRSFVAYPSVPSAIGSAIHIAIERLRTFSHWDAITSWPQNDVAGRFLADPIFARIGEAELLIADVTKLNFNVAYEIGYAIGQSKRVILILNKTIQSDRDVFAHVGIFDTLGYREYSNGADLAEALGGTKDLNPLAMPLRPSLPLPLYLVMPKDVTDFEIRLQARVKKSRLGFRSFDPQEEGRLSSHAAIDNVAMSSGVVVPLLPQSRLDAVVHNIRAAFVSGLAAGAGIPLLLMQTGADPVPLDVRDLVTSVTSLDQVNTAIADFAPLVTERLLQRKPKAASAKESRLARTQLGASAAENEFDRLGDYFLRTAEYDRVSRGEIQVVAGRKGSGKTALFSQVRDSIRRNRKNIVLDLMPEGYRLLKFKEAVLDRVQQGGKEHLMTALWEYLLLLEVCHKLLHKDEKRHLFDHELNKPYRELEQRYRTDAYVAEGDFAERMSMLLDRIAEDATPEALGAPGSKGWTERVTQIVYKHDISALRASLLAYLQHKDSVWILFDNLDKGWPPFGVTADDITSFRCLLDAFGKVHNLFKNHNVPSRGVVFIRNDVFELLVQGSPDRGKLSSVLLDWTDPDLLREMLRLRLLMDGDLENTSFAELWQQVCVSHVKGEETSQYLIDRCLMRPRALIDLVQACRSHGLNLGRDRIQEQDIDYGEDAFSTELAKNVQFEIRDVFPPGGDVLYQLMGRMNWLSIADLKEVLTSAKVPTDRLEYAADLLLWYGVLGYLKDGGDSETYIYNAKYDLRRLKASEQRQQQAVYCVNPAFWKGLEIKT